MAQIQQNNKNKCVAIMVSEVRDMKREKEICKEPKTYEINKKGDRTQFPQQVQSFMQLHKLYGKLDAFIISRSPFEDRELPPVF